MGSFLKLEDFLAPPPLPAIIAVLMVLGLQFLANRAMQKLKIESPQAVQLAAAFILVTALVAAAVHMLALAQMAHIIILRTLAVSLAMLGMWQACNLFRLFPRSYLQIKAVFREQHLVGKVALVLLMVTGLGLLLAALGPPTDSDSLCYHLGVPLDILRHHGSHPRTDWLHARLTGLGESLNLLGLAGGTDILGASLQFAGVVIVLVAVISLAKDNRDKILLSLGVLGCPVLAFLVPNQKPQMLPVAATTIALILIAQRFAAIDILTIGLSFGCVFFAMSCKYPFLLSGAVVVGIGMIGAYRAGILGKAMVISLLGLAIFTLPLYLQNYLYYGDPISPFAERFRNQGDAILIRFASYLRGFKDKSMLPFPLKYIFPDSLGKFTTVIGLGPLLGLVGLKACRKEAIPRVLCSGAILAATGTFLFGQVTPRFLLEPYFWAISMAAFVTWGPLKNICLRLLVCQTLIMALMVGFGALTLFPGSLTTSLRNKTMIRSAEDFATTRWLNEVLPQDSVVLAADIRSLALMGRPFMSGDYLLQANLGDPGEREKVLSMMKLYGVNTMVARFPLSASIKQNLGPYLDGRLAGPKEFLQGKRNPWNRKEISLVVYRLNPNNPHAGSLIKRDFDNQGRL